MGSCLKTKFPSLTCERVCISYMFLKNALSLSLSLFQEVGLGAKTSAFHQKQQVAGSIPGVNLSKKKKGVRLPTNHDSKTLQNGSFVHWV